MNERPGVNVRDAAAQLTGAGGQSSVLFRSDGLRLHASRHAGRGLRPVVVVPGVTTPAGGFASIAAAMADLPLVSEVYVLDMRGRGLSERAGAGRHRASDYAEDVLALVEQLSLPEPLLVGHSLGARVGVRARAAVPGYSCGVLAIDPVLSGPGRPAYPSPLAHFVNELHGARAGLALEQARARFPGWSEEQLAQRARWIGTCDELAIVESYAWFHLETFEESWESVLPPAMLLAGAESPAVTADDVKRLAELNPRAQVRLADRSGHMVPWDNLQAVLDAMTELLSQASED